MLMLVRCTCRGVIWCSVKDVTADGYGMQFGTNVLGHFLLMQLLLHALLKGKETPGDGHARVVAISSAYTYEYIGHVDFDTLKDGSASAWRKQSTELLCRRSKLDIILVTFEMARRYGEQRIVGVTLRPGILKTDLLRHTNFLRKAALVRMLY